MQAVLDYVLISTHTLTWSVTRTSLQSSTGYSISTHTLTWSVTICVGFLPEIYKDFNSHAHVERDKDSAFVGKLVNDFNSHAHVERDLVSDSFPAHSLISTHTLTWSVTRPPHDQRSGQKISTHTLTWSVTGYLARL